MKIIELKAENIKRLVAVEIKPTGNVVEITGKNGQGKTSVLDSIWWALGGAKDIQKSPIRNGADSGFVRLDLGDIVVTRSFKRQDDNPDVTTRLTVENKEGVKFPSPQAMLDKLLGDLSFDPLVFARASADEQFNKLRQFVPDIDFAAIEAANKSDYEQRTELNRRAKEKRAAAAQIQILNPNAKHVNVSELMAEMNKADKHNIDIASRSSNRDAMRRDIQRLNQQIKDLTFQKEQLEFKLSNAGPLPERIEMSMLTKKVDEANLNNKQADLIQQKKDLEQAAQDLELASSTLTDHIEKRNANKQAKIAAANLPVKGISFGDNQIMLNGVPFNQGSDAEQLRASIGIAMALNTKLRMIRVRDGSLLDDDSMKMLEKMANESDCQVWIERVGEGKVGYIIEDGHIKTHFEGEPEAF